MFADPLCNFLTETPYDSHRSMPRSNCGTPGQGSMGEVFPARGAPGSASVGARSRAPLAGGIISVATHNGEELHYPVVQGRAGGSLSPHLHSAEWTSSIAAQSNVAARAHQHTPVTGRFAPTHSMLQGAMDSGGTNEGETTADAQEAYRQSRLTPSWIQRHRRASGAARRSPPPALALRSEQVEDVMQASTSHTPTPSWSLSSTPRHSIQHTPLSSSQAWRSGMGAETALDRSANVDRCQHPAPEVVPIRIEEVGVSTPEMAEYFAESAVDAVRQRRSSWMLNSSSACCPICHTQSLPRCSLPENSSRPTVWSDTHTVLERLMRFMEDQSASMQKLHQRMGALESTSNSLLERVQKIESSTPANADSINRVSVESPSPSVTRTSDSLESAPRPSTRAPSKPVD
ncbi:hypothetical protein, conserved [Leishmania shawi]|uniref:Uncharacterized protein n=1 Tax=Leishmania shawi TaxID=5680 RepID=A0ABR3DXW4_9TRYP